MVSLPQPLGFIPGAVALPLAPVAVEAAAGAAVAVAAVAVAPLEIPLLAAAALVIGAGLLAGVAWDALNSNEATQQTSEVTSWTLNNPSQTTTFASFSTYPGDYNQGKNAPRGWVHQEGDDATAMPPGYTGWPWATISVEIPPGSSSISIKYIASGNTQPNQRDWFWQVQVGGQSYQQSIIGYAPGYWLRYAIVHLTDSVTATSAPQDVAKPNSLTPQAFKEKEKPKPIAPPLPYLPSFVPDIGTPIAPEQTPSTPGDPGKKEEPQAPPSFWPSEVPIWQPAITPATTPGPATSPRPLQDPQSVPSQDPLRPNVLFDTAGVPIPKIAPAPKTTPVDQHQVGNIPIPARAPQPTLQGIAEEVGRIEQKLEIMMNPGTAVQDISWMDNLGKLIELLFAVTAGGDYQLSSQCQLDDSKQRIVKTAHYDGSIDRIGILDNKLDAIAELMQHSKDLKQPACIPPIPRSTVTVTAYEVMEA